MFESMSLIPGDKEMFESMSLIPGDKEMFESMSLISGDKEMFFHKQGEKLIKCWMDEIVNDDTNEAENVSSTDHLFLHFFLTEEMDADFDHIARDFLKHTYGKLSLYYNLQYAEEVPAFCGPTRAYHLFILNLMMGAVRQGDEQTRIQFCNLYKKYYRKEYQQLKRFKTMSGKEVIDVAGGPVEMSWIDVARVLTMAGFFDIKKDIKCKCLYKIIDDGVKKAELHMIEALEVLDLSEQSIEEAKLLVARLYADEDEQTAYLEKVDAFLENTLRVCATANNYVDLEDTCSETIDWMLIRAAAVLRRIYDDEVITKEMLAFGTLVFRITKVMTGTISNLFESVKSVCGIGEENEICNGEETKHFEKDKTKQEQKPEVQMTICESADNQKMMDEITRLKEKIYRQTNDNVMLRHRIHEQEEKICDFEKLAAKYEASKEELAALRSHVYHMTEYDVISDEMAADMKAEIADCRVAIVGGHDRWVNKLKSLFPKWLFIQPRVSGTVDKKQIKHSDQVYFFTDTISHGTYYRYIQIVRSQGIPFGYIHSVNINANIEQIYNDLSEKQKYTCRDTWVN